MTDPTPRRHPLSLSSQQRDGKHRKKASLLGGQQKADRAVFVQMQTERTVLDAKTAKLRALRLEKEESDRQASVVAEKAPKP